MLKLPEIFGNNVVNVRPNCRNGSTAQPENSAKAEKLIVEKKFQKKINK